MVAVNRRLLVGSIAVAAVLAIGLGWAVSRDDGNDASQGIEMTDPGLVEMPNLGTNAPREGKDFPSVTVQDMDGNDVETASLLGQPLVVNFWNTTCTPCRKEMPLLGAKAAALDGKVRFVGVNNLPDVGDPAGFAAEHGADYLQLFDENAELLTPAGVGVLPVTLFVSPDGQILRQKAGELSEAELDAAIAEAFPGL
jgi:thiol-disulfide isomerase/thioredoxin